MLVDKTNFGLVLYNHANFYRFEETSSYWSAKRISVFLCFSLVYQRHTSGIMLTVVFSRKVTNIENTVRAVHSCNSWFTNIILAPTSRASNTCLGTSLKLRPYLAHLARRAIVSYCHINASGVRRPSTLDNKYSNIFFYKTTELQFSNFTWSIT